jgi:hypothetical protein
LVTKPPESLCTAAPQLLLKGFRELDSRDQLADRCEAAWKRWDTVRKAVEQSANQDVQQAGIR